MTRSNIFFSIKVHRWSGQVGLTYWPSHKLNSVPANTTSDKISSNHLPVNIALVRNIIHIHANDHSTWVSVFRLPAATEKQFSSIISAALEFSEATETHQKYPGKNYVHQQNTYLCAMAAMCPEFVKTCITGWSSKWGNINPTILLIFIPLFPPHAQHWTTNHVLSSVYLD